MRVQPSAIVTQRDLVEGMCRLGLLPGDGVMVHSSLRSFGRVIGGPKAVILALMEVVTWEGTLLFPSFNHGAPFEAGGAGYYDPATTPTTNGAIADCFWRMPGVHRSLNPTHAFAVWGRHAKRYTGLHHRTLTMGPESPLGLLASDGGQCLLMGISYGANTFHHVVEMSTGAPCLGLRTESYPVRLSDEHMVEGRTWGWRDKPCPFTDGGRYAEEMHLQGLERKTMIGDSVITLYRLQDCYGVIERILSEGEAGYPPCSGCSIRPRTSPFTVISDWDSEQNQLHASAAAWSY